MKNIFICLVLLGLLTTSCKDDDLTPDEQRASDVEKIEKYLADNNLTAQKTDEDLYYIIDEPGTGFAYPNLQSEVDIIYRGYFLDGEEFDGGPDVIPIPLASVIEGWKIGIPLFKLGGKGTLLVPSYLGYGSFGSGPPANIIPPNTVILFDIEIVSFTLSHEEQLHVDTLIIEQYLADNSLMAEKTPAHLYYIIEEEGTGADFPVSDSQIEISYTGTLTDGRVFDETEDGETVSLLLSQSMLGWQLGIPFIKKEGRIKLILPSSLAYGNVPPLESIIPKNAVVIFDIDLVNFE